MTHLLRLSDLDAARLRRILDLAEATKKKPLGFIDELRGETLACYFEKPSTRTRVSFAAAAWRLGMLPIGLRPDELQLGRGEEICDTARVLSGYNAAIVMRTFAQATVEEMARWATVPVINALTDEHHPCQALADVLTLRERFGRLDGLVLAYVGDGNNVCHSLIEAAPLTGIALVVATPPGREPSHEIVAAARRRGGAVAVTTDPREAVESADAVYTDVWFSMGDEEGREARLPLLEPYRVTPELMALAARHAVFLHCLPAHRGEEVAAEVIDGPASLVFPQAQNREHTEQALLHALVLDDWDSPL